MENAQISAPNEATRYILPVHHDIRLLQTLVSTRGIYQE